MVFAFDVDGTIIPNSSNFIEDDTLMLLKDLAIYNKVVFSSARPIFGIKNLIPKALQNVFDYVSLNGAYSVLNGKEYEHCKIPLNYIETLINNFSNKDLWLYSNNKWFSSNFKSTAYKKEAFAVKEDALPLKQMSTSDNILKVVVVSDNKDELINLNLENLEYYFSNSNYIEINYVGVNKSLFIEQADFEESRLCSFGDAENDLPLLISSRFAINMNYANSKLKKISSYSTVNKYYLGLIEGLNFINNKIN